MIELGGTAVEGEKMCGQASGEGVGGVLYIALNK